MLLGVMFDWAQLTCIIPYITPLSILIDNTPIEQSLKPFKQLAVPIYKLQFVYENLHQFII